ncbi:Rpn family recombination-promoting nuclease/putative transposase [Allochromatium palmeri]|uniref:Rpn family recombination-promoting nuclease/putative transposase n=1 Tax=Allochromatium palmeri TaxID=231048 RepID=A0A6N8EB46_9GAMM|nr:Rpn family recombination-promoting nuclease/putative transposase [Allochromatium palmeri]MTW19876.1 Rpn family recombination-promoting nuclease/putative transposase [Allochromatium palmeri]
MPETTTALDLLDPKNDYVFKRLFGEAPELLVALINDLRPDLPEITAVEVLNPNIDPAELSGKYIILDVLARDAASNVYNVEIQVRRYGAWHKRGLYYLARTLSRQLGTGEDYDELRAVVGIHLLDFDLFTATPAQKAQALWRFEMRDRDQPTVTLGNVLQLNLIELRKADRLGLGSGPLSGWVTFFEHWREEQRMATIDHAPIQDALSRVRQLSADEEARRLAFVRERALRDEVSFLKEARQEGFQQGRQEGRQEGLQEGRQAEAATILLQLLALKFGALTETAQTRVQQADADTLRAWTARVLTTHSLEDVFVDRDQE